MISESGKRYLAACRGVESFSAFNRLLKLEITRLYLLNNSKAFQLKYSKRADLIRIFNFFYDYDTLNKGLFLKRKYDKFLEFFNPDFYRKRYLETICKDHYPSSNELWSFIESHPEFLLSLKIFNLQKFEFIPLIFVLTLPPEHPRFGDEILGFWYVDKENLINNQMPIFKQDYVVNKNKGGKEFISYSRDVYDGEFVKPLREFFSIYGVAGKYFHDNLKPDHHYKKISDLPDEKLKLLAENIINKLQKSSD